MAESPFQDLVVADWKFLDSSDSRSKCPKCHRSRKYYCYSCCIPLPHLAAGVPNVKLPVKIDIIKHPSETDGKSTAPHAVILAPDDVVIHTYPCIPDYDNEKVMLIFPGDQSITLEDLAVASTSSQPPAHEGRDSSSGNCDIGTVQKHPASPVRKSSSETISPLTVVAAAEDLRETDDGVEKRLDNIGDDESKTSPSVKETDSRGNKRSIGHPAVDGDGDQLHKVPPKKMRGSPCVPFERVVFIDSTWNQTNTIVSDERLKNLKRIELRSRNSNFWRHQEGVPGSYLSTIEAIFYFCKDVHQLFLASHYDHNYDNLLFFFCYIHNKIHNSSSTRKEKRDKKVKE